jgi:hypothetical protein
MSQSQSQISQSPSHSVIDPLTHSPVSQRAWNTLGLLVGGDYTDVECVQRALEPGSGMLNAWNTLGLLSGGEFN